MNIIKHFSIAALLLVIVLTSCGRNKNLTNDYFTKAYNQARDGDHAAAEKTYTEYLKRERNADAYYNRGYSRHMLGRYEDAISDYSEAIKLKKGNYPDAYANRAMSYEMIADKQRAKDDYAKAIELAPADGEMLVYMAMFLHRENDYAEAMKYYERASKMLPNNDQMWYYMGSIKFSEGDYNEALAHFIKAAELAPKNSNSVYWKAESLLELKRFDEALAAFNSAISMDPKNAKAYESRAYIYFERGDYEKSMEDAEKSIKLGHTTSEVCVYIGNSARMLGDRKKAEEYLTRAIQLDPKSYYAYWGRGELYYQHREDRKACDDLQTALDLVNNEAHKKRLTDTYNAYCK